MTETPRRPHTPQPEHPQDPEEGPQHPEPAATRQRQPYAGPEWRRPDADATTPSSQYQPYSATAGPDSAGPDPAGPDPAGSDLGGSSAAAHAGTTHHPADAAGPWGYAGPADPAGPANPSGAAGPPSGFPPPGAAPWPYPTPAKPAPRRGRQLVAVAAITAVLGGLVGGGAVAAFDRGSTAAPTSGITRESGTAPTSADQSGTVEAAAATAMKSVVTLNVGGGQESGTGSGVVIRADGYILTNEHVVAAAGSNGRISVTFADGRTATATVVGTDKATDLAVVKVNGVSGLTAAAFADSDAVKVGQTVVAVGSPLGLDGTVTEGIISALHRPATGASDDSAVIDALQTDAPINPGNSGGALVDLAGRVVGINQSIATAGSNDGLGGAAGSGSGNIGIGFAIPSNTAARIAEQLIATGSATHGFLGVQVGGSSSASSTGATIASVESGGPAADAGMRAGDVVTAINGRAIGDGKDLVAAIRALAPGEKVTLAVQRDGAQRTVAVTLGSDADR